MILYWYSKEKFCLGHSQELKGPLCQFIDIINHLGCLAIVKRNCKSWAVNFTKVNWKEEQFLKLFMATIFLSKATTDISQVTAS